MLALGVQAGYINSEQDYDSEVKSRRGRGGGGEGSKAACYHHPRFGCNVLLTHSRREGGKRVCS